MRTCLTIISIFVIALETAPCFGQQLKDTGRIGVAEGITIDTTHNYRLQAATVAVYKQNDNGLVNYQLTDNYGAFKLEHLPIEVPLYIKVTFIGYKNLEQNFIIHQGTANYDFKYLYAERSSGELSDVIIKSVPPVIMNGDTLEFNADAFKLDKNAVTEDLLKKLPGVIVWGDGSITVNGKEVKSVLVNGKPFFNGETKIATQNIPKDAVDKVQVYRKNLNNPNPYDSTSEINIKLKEGKDRGHFGSLSAGYGSRAIYELDGSLNFFRKNTHLSIVGAGNNSNKLADSLSTILRNSTYKGVGASIEYQPDFSLPGSNETIAAGVRLDHDFIDFSDDFHKNHLTTSYFFKRNNRLLEKTLNSIIALPDGNSQFKQSSDKNKQFQSGHNADVSYDTKITNNHYFLNAAFNTLNINMDNQQNIAIKNNEGGLLSRNLTQKYYNSKASWGHFDGGYKYEPSLMEHRKRLHLYNFNYALNAGRKNFDQLLITDFAPEIKSSATDSNHIDRKYSGQDNYTDHTLSITLGDFSDFIFRKTRGISVKINNDLYYHKKNITRKVRDLDSASNHYLTNNDLSVNREENTFDERPGLRLSKMFFKGLSNRYLKSVTIGLNIDGQFYGTHSKSSQAFQRKNINYERFIPQFEVIYDNSEYGRFHDQFSWRLHASYLYPTIDQLVPIVDSSNFYNLQLGNQYLRPASKKELIFGWFHSGFRFKNTFNYNIFFNTNIIDHYFSDSSFTDQAGRTAHYLINVNGRKSIGLNGGLNRALKIHNNLFLITFRTSINYSTNPLYVNSIKSHSAVVNSLGNIGLLYNFRDNLAINIDEQYLGYHSNQRRPYDKSFDNKLWTTKLSVSKNLSKRFAAGTNISYNKSTSSVATASNFTIWNANVRYRALKGNNLEVKFSALDLLHQNNSIINEGSNNVLTHGYVNVLENYFMLTITFFPRKFGINE